MKKTFLITIILGCIMGFYQPLYSQDNIENGHEWVDLGLSVKWATCNVGAKTAEEYGNYYAWGETKPKDAYSGSSSVTYGLNNSDLKAQGIIDEDGNLTSSYDAAAANWGGDWKMPTIAEMNELESKCTWEWIKQNGVRGYKVTGPNGNFIFLPNRFSKAQLRQQFAHIFWIRVSLIIFVVSCHLH